MELKKVDPFDEEDIHLFERRLALRDYAHPDSVVNKRGLRKKRKSLTTREL